MSFTARARAAVDLEALRKAWSLCCTRHAQLRATFHEGDGRGCERIATKPPHLEEVDARVWNEEQLRVRVSEDHRRPFDLAVSATRAALYRTVEAGGVLVITCHHLVCDVTAFDILIEDLFAAYESEHSGGPAPPPLLAPTYAEFVDARRGELARDNGESTRFWKEELATVGAEARLDIVEDRAQRTSGGSTRSVISTFRLEVDVVAALRKVHPNTFRSILAAYAVLLHGYRQARAATPWDVVIGVSADNRGERFAGVFGYFVNMLPLVVRVDERTTFKTLLEGVEQRLRAALKHRAYPFSQVVRNLRIPVDLDSTPLFQAAFTFHGNRNLRVRAAGGCFIYGAPWKGSFGGLELEAFSVPQREALYRIQLGIGELADGSIAGELQGDADSYRGSTVDAMRDHFTRMIRSIARDPNVPIEELGRLDVADRRRLITAWSGPLPSKANDGSCLHDLFANSVARTPEAVAAEDDTGSITYRSLDDSSSAVAEQLVRAGVRPDDAVGVLVGRSVAALIGMLGVLKAGAAYLPLDPEHPEARLRQILTDSGARMVVVREATAASSLAIPFLALSAAPTHPAEGFARPKVSSQQLAYVIYTSGSTGQPKGVCITHDTVTAFVRALLEAEALTEGIRCAQYANLTFDAHVSEIWPALAVGGSVNFVPSESRLDARSFIEWLVDKRIQRCFAPTPFAEHCFRVAWPACDLKVFIVGGDVLHGVREALPFCLKNYYGPTECTCAAVGCDVAPSGDLAPIGRPFAGVRLYVLDPSLEPVPPAAPGELYIGGALVGRGYLGQSALTAEKFLPDPFSAEPGARMYRTGDHARLGPDGLAYFCGRLDDQVKLRGVRIELGEIEAAILESSSVREAIVVVRAEDGGPKRLVAYIVALGDGAVAAVRSELLAKLPLYMIPASFVVLASLPRMSTGKVDRRALPAPTEPSSAPVADTSNSEIEDFVATIWREVLGVSRIHAHESFFDLGGHSLTASQVVIRIRQLLGADLPVRALFDFPTVASFSRCVVEAMVRSLSPEARVGPPAA